MTASFDDGHGKLLLSPATAALLVGEVGGERGGEAMSSGDGHGELFHFLAFVPSSREGDKNEQGVPLVEMDALSSQRDDHGGLPLAEEAVTRAGFEVAESAGFGEANVTLNGLVEDVLVVVMRFYRCGH